MRQVNNKSLLHVSSAHAALITGCFLLLWSCSSKEEENIRGDKAVYTSIVEETNSSNLDAAAEERLQKISAFAPTLYALVKANCGGCHGTTTGPKFASSHIEEAYDSIEASQLVNFQIVGESRIVKRLKMDKHNCWGDCDENAAEMSKAILAWSTSIGGYVEIETVNIQSMGLKVSQATKLYPNDGSAVQSFDIVSDNANAINGASIIDDPTNPVGSKSLTFAAHQIQDCNNNPCPSADYNFGIAQSGDYEVWVFGKGSQDNSNVGLSIDGFGNRQVQFGTEWGWSRINNPFNFDNIGGLNNFVLKMFVNQQDRDISVAAIGFVQQGTLDYSERDSLPLSQLDYDLSDILGVTGSRLSLGMTYDTVKRYVILSNPRLHVPSGTVKIKGLKVLVNGLYNPQQSTYSQIDEEVSAPGGGVLNGSSMVINVPEGNIEDIELMLGFDELIAE